MSSRPGDKIDNYKSNNKNIQVCDIIGMTRLRKNHGVTEGCISYIHSLLWHYLYFYLTEKEYKDRKLTTPRE